MTDEEITELLFVRREPVPAELVMVFAADCEKDMARRTRRGVALYREGYAPRLLVTGGGVLARKRPEAKRMAEIARELGVPDADLLVEARSGNTFQNVQFSRAIVEERGLLDELGTVLLVSAEWHMGRVLGTMKRFFPARLRLVCCPTTEGCSRATWAKSPSCRQVVLSELLLLQTLRETGAI